MNHLKGLHVLVLGLGDSGLAMARWCLRCEAARVVVADTRQNPPQAAALQAQCPQVLLKGGALTPDLLEGTQLLLKSPGLSPLDPQIAPLLTQAEERGIAVRNELSLFATALADLKAERGYEPTVLAITGTNGKTTTTSLTALLLERSGWRVGLAGNIGPTMLQTLSEALDAPDAKDAEGAENALPDAWVLELSSFQLDGVTNFEPTAAAVLNVSQDHLDWHGDMAAYASAKARIFGRDDARTVMVVNADDPVVRAMIPAPPPSSAAPHSGKKRGAKVASALPLARKELRFSLHEPQRPGDFGVVADGGIAWLTQGSESDDAEQPCGFQRLMPVDALRIRGRHNAANALAALALTLAVKRPLAPLLHALREYRGEPHRVEFIASIGGIEVFDDSKGTNVGATVAALYGLGVDRAPARLVVILGGDGKGQDFAPLAEPVARFARAVALIGRDAQAIWGALTPLHTLYAAPDIERFDTLEAATRWSLAQARSGDAVLLSPACASFDMFSNYAHRAEVFIHTVQKWAADRGEIAA